MPHMSELEVLHSLERFEATCKRRSTRAKLVAVKKINEHLNSPNLLLLHELSLSSGIIRRLVKLACHSHPELQFQTIKLLAKITENEDGQNNFVRYVELPSFIENLITSNNDKICNEGLQLIKNVIADEISDDKKNRFIEAGVISFLLKMTNPSKSLELLEELAIVMCYFCVASQPHIIEQLFPAVNVFMEGESPKILHYALRVIICGVHSGSEIINKMITAGFISKAVELLAHPDVIVQFPAVRVMAGMLTTDFAEHVQTILDCGALQHFPLLLASDISRSDVYCALLNITDGSETNVKAVFDANIFPIIVRELSEGTTITTKTLACFIIINGVKNCNYSERENMIEYLVGLHVIQRIFNLLESEEAELIRAALVVLNVFFGIYSGCGAIEENILSIVDACNGFKFIKQVVQEKAEVLEWRFLDCLDFIKIVYESAE